MKKNITREEVEHVAELAKISLNEKELENMQEEISNILTYIIINVNNYFEIFSVFL